MGKKLLRNKWFVLFIIIMVLYPKFINFTVSSDLTPVKIAWHALFRVMAVLFFIMIIMFWKVSPKAKPLYLSIIIYHLIFVISNIVNDVDFSSHLLFFRNALWNIGIVVFLCSAIHVNPRMTLRLFRNVCIVMAVIHFVFLIIMPGGFAKQVTVNTLFNTTSIASIGFIDAKNRLSFFFIPALLATIIYDKLYAKKEKSYILVLLTILIMIMEWSGTGIVATAFFILYIIFSKRETIQKIMSTKIVIIVYAIIYFVIVVMQNFSVFQFLIENILHKNMTLTGRTNIWKYYIAMIVQKPILGYGTGDEGVYYKELGTRYYAHSQALDILIQAGVIALVAFVVIIIISKKYIDSGKERYYSGLANAALFSFLIIGIGEHFLINMDVGFWIFLAIAYASRSLFTNEVEKMAKNKGLHFRIRKRVGIRR